MTATAWLVAVVGGLLTYLVRLSFLAVAHRTVDLPPLVREGLRMIPPAALAALVAPAVLRGGGTIQLADPRVPAAVLAILVMWRTGSVVGTLLVGLGVLAALQLLGWG